MSYDKLKGRIREVYKTDTAFANALGLNRATLSKKLNDRAEWSRTEMEAACRLLNISLRDMSDYFFTP